MGHKNQYRSRKRKFTGNQYRNKRSSIDSQAKNDTTVASNIELKTARASKLEDLKDKFLENLEIVMKVSDIEYLMSPHCFQCLHYLVVQFVYMMNSVWKKTLGMEYVQTFP
ncbi:hypothetical protein TNCV_59181 [Trichonephila clavipes]|nr:hypothetical protein TNCV_59181 [Trichonephila clavipes]